MNCPRLLGSLYYKVVTAFCWLTCIFSSSAIRISGGWCKIKACGVGLLAVSKHIFHEFSLFQLLFVGYKYPPLVFYELTIDMGSFKANFFAASMLKNGFKLLFFTNWGVTCSGKDILLACFLAFCAKTRFNSLDLNTWLAGFDHGSFRQFSANCLLYLCCVINVLDACLFSTINCTDRYVVVKVHGSWMEFRDYFRQQVLFIS